MIILRFWGILLVLIVCTWIIVEGDDEDVMEYIEEEEEEVQPTARPRRMSEIRSSIKVKPLPKASSFFVFSHKNR